MSKENVDLMETVEAIYEEVMGIKASEPVKASDEFNFEEVQAASEVIKATQINAGATFVGVYSANNVSIDFGSQMFHIDTPDGEKVIFGTAELNSKMKNVPLGSTVRIIYTGATLTKNGKSFHKWSVSVAK
jgi:hypothetical protein